MPDLRRRRRLYFLISAFGLALSLWGMHGLWRLSALPPDFPAADVRYPATVGNVVVGSPEQLRFLTQSRPAGSVVEVRSQGVTVRARLVPQLSRLHFFLVFFVGLIFLAVNIFVFCPLVDRGPVRDFYWCTLLYGVAIMINGIYFPRAPAWTGSVLPLVWIACLALLPVFFFHMTLTFPRRSGFLDRRPEAMPILAALAVGLVAWRSLAFLRHFRDPNPAT